MIFRFRLEGEKYKKAVQWRLAIVNLFWLHDVLFGQNDALQLSTISKKYQQFDSKDPFKIDYSTVPHLMNPWRTPLPFSEEYIKSRIAEKNDKQLKSNSKDDIENKKETLESEENANEPQTKKIKLQEKSPVIVKEELSSPSLALNVIPNLQTSNPDLARNIKVMFTAINSNRDNLKSIVQNLGGRVTNSCSECTHLITDRIARTVKFMCAFSSCKFILTSDWILESAKQNRFANELQFILNDTEREKYFNFNLQNSLQKRNPELFKGIVFYISHGCIPSPSLLKEMIESVGGIAVTTKRPTKRQLAKMRENGLKFIVITCENDLHMCDVFFSRNVGKKTIQNVSNNLNLIYCLLYFDRCRKCRVCIVWYFETRSKH
jgi:PAX-interacting protein 1